MILNYSPSFSKGKNKFLEPFFWTCFLLIIAGFLLAHPTNLAGNNFYLFLKIFKIFIIIVTIIALFLALHFFRHYRIMEDTPTSKIRSCAQGYVELEGKQLNHPNFAIQSFLSKRPCTWYEYKIEEYRRSGKNKKWITIEENYSKDPFIINDNTGKCTVIPEGAKIISKNKIIWYGNTRYAMPSKNKISNIFNTIIGRYRMTEYILKPNSYIYAIGMFDTKDKQNFLSKNNLPKRRPFIISAIAQKKLLQKYKFKASLYLLLFAILVLTAIKSDKIYYSVWNELAELPNKIVNQEF